MFITTDRLIKEGILSGNSTSNCYFLITSDLSSFIESSSSKSSSSKRNLSAGEDKSIAQSVSSPGLSDVKEEDIEENDKKQRKSDDGESGEAVVERVPGKSAVHQALVQDVIDRR